MVSILATQVAAKLWEVKVEGWINNLTFLVRDNVSLSKSDTVLAMKCKFIWPPTLASRSFAAPWATKVNSVSFEIPEMGAIGLCLKEVWQHFLIVLSPFYSIKEHLFLNECEALYVLP